MYTNIICVFNLKTRYSTVYYGAITPQGLLYTCTCIQPIYSYSVCVHCIHVLFFCIYLHNILLYMHNIMHVQCTCMCAFVCVYILSPPSTQVSVSRLAGVRLFWCVCVLGGGNCGGLNGFFLFCFAWLSVIKAKGYNIASVPGLPHTRYAVFNCKR